MSTVSEKDTRLPKLKDDGTSNNYGAFETVASIKLEEQGLWKNIDGPESVAPVVPEVVEPIPLRGPLKSVRMVGGNLDVVRAAEIKLATWKSGDLKARRLIMEALPDDKIDLVASANSAKETWEIIRDEYRAVNEIRAQTLHQQIMAFRCTPEILSVCPTGTSRKPWSICCQSRTIGVTSRGR